MSNHSKLIFIKALHTLIWLFFNFVIGYMLYVALWGKIGFQFWVCLGLVVIEGLVLAIFRFSCPLTIIARKYSNLPEDNFDIFLPDWLARNTKRIYTSLVIVIIIIVFLRILKS